MGRSGVRPLDQSQLNPLSRNIDVMFLLRIIVDDVSKVLQEVVSATAMNDIGPGPETKRDRDSSPPERDH